MQRVIGHDPLHLSTGHQSSGGTRGHPLKAQLRKREVHLRRWKGGM